MFPPRVHFPIYSSDVRREDREDYARGVVEKIVEALNRKKNGVQVLAEFERKHRKFYCKKSKCNVLCNAGGPGGLDCNADDGS